MKFHPLAETFPLMEETELKDLIQDIEKNGLIGSITVYQEKILDGRNRFLACKNLKIEPRFRQFKGPDPVAFIISANLHRRHLNASQRSMVVAKLETALNSQTSNSGITVPIGTVIRKRGRPPKSSNTEKLAKLMNVGKRSARRAKKVLKEGTKDQVAKVEQGKSNVSAEAAKIDKRKRKKAGKRGELVDKTGYPIPTGALEYWNRTNEVREILRHISKARAVVRQIDAKDPMFVEVNLNEVHGSLNQAYNAFEPALPYAVCPICQGAAPETCTLCRGRSVISKFKWDICVPEELKDLRKQAAKKG